MMRARLIAAVSSRCCLAVRPVMRRGKILPRSVTNFLSSSTSVYLMGSPGLMETGGGERKP
jgi:hypothetical protein